MVAVLAAVGQGFADQAAQWVVLVLGAAPAPVALAHQAPGQVVFKVPALPQRVDDFAQAVARVLVVFGAVAAGIDVHTQGVKRAVLVLLGLALCADVAADLAFCVVFVVFLATVGVVYSRQGSAGVDGAGFEVQASAVAQRVGDALGSPPVVSLKLGDLPQFLIY